ncbi:DUF4102 domain-containing protein [Sinirhodobacter populi]|uniref:DUF4102 domain-containing protein n=1 Tax=Paenirhodobacter populi TaxID=2306993 RepID=A0A443JX66_9RHOB|nr:tyrosine-type recombinase/integrase [Sinirhodobacter populi]RWR25113.1 DUF4102 domain-containing protein [Sinirhodobacter populi]
MKVKFSKGAIDALPRPASGQKIYWFEEGDGFGIRITPNARTFVFEKRIDGVKRRVPVCKVPVDMDTKFLNEAKAAAKSLAADFAKGVDPVAEKKRKAAEAARKAATTVTLREAFQRYACAGKQKGSGKGTAKKPRTIRDIEKVTGKHFEKWLDKPVTSITGDMIAERHAEIVANADALRAKTQKKLTGRSAQADLAMRYLRAAMNHMNDSSDDDDPVIRPKIIRRVSRVGTGTPMRKPRHVPDGKIPAWVEAVRTGFEGRDFGMVYRDALLFLMLTGARLGEVMGSAEDGYPPLAWTDVDLEKRTVTFRNTKNRSDHTLPMGNALTEMLLERKKRSVSDVVFSDETGRVPGTLRGGYEHIKSLIGVYATPHDLRRTFATVAEKMDMSEYKLKRLLNHTKANVNVADDEANNDNESISNADTTSAYIQISFDDLREPMQKIEDHILRKPSVDADGTEEQSA